MSLCQTTHQKILHGGKCPEEVIKPVLQPNLFGRKYSLVTGVPARLPDELITASYVGNVQKGTRLYNYNIDSLDILEARFIEIKDNHIAVKITQSKTSSTSGSITKLTIEGLSKESREDNFFNGDIILLNAGYEQDTELPRIFAGEVIKRENFTSGIKNTTVVTIGEAFTLLRQVKLSVSYPPDTTYYDVLIGIINDLRSSGVTFGSDDTLRLAEPTLSRAVFKTGYSNEGGMDEVLKAITKKLKWRYYISNGIFFLEPKDYPMTKISYTLNENNVIGSPEVISTNINRGVTNSQETGYRFNIFLDGRVRVDNLLNVTFGDFKGTYKIDSITHVLNYEGSGGSSWKTMIDCKREDIDDAT